MFPQRKVEITPPNMQTAIFAIEGIAPYVQLRFSEKAQAAMLDKQKAGSKVRSKNKEAKDVTALFEGAMYVLDSGGRGIPCSSFRNALISACRLVGFPMTKAKLGFFIECDAIDKLDGTPLVKISGEPHMVIHHVRNATGVADLRVRAMWDQWSAQVRVTFDADLFSLEDVSNLLARAGLQVGIGEGRPDSKQSTGMGWGQFKLGGAPNVAEA